MNRRVHIGLRQLRALKPLLPAPAHTSALDHIADALGPEKPRTRQNDEAEVEFGFQCRAMRLPEFQRQFWIEQSAYPGNARRRWRFDWVNPPYNLIVEIDGGVWMAGGGAHSKPGDIERNMRKRNDAALLGFVVLAFTPREVSNGRAIAFTQKVLAARGWAGPNQQQGRTA